MVSKIPWPEFRETEAPLEQLVKLSRFYGADVDFVVAAGGNTSVKVGERLFIKGSGTHLAAIDAEGFVELERAALEALLSADLGSDPGVREERFKNAILAARVYPEKDQRPSVESVLHHILPGRFVVHTHAATANWLACSGRGQEIAAELFGERVLWVAYVDPGFTLARAAHQALRRYADPTGRDHPRAVLLQNHGLIVCGDSPEEVRRNTDWIMDSIRACVGSLPLQEPFGPVTRIEAEQGRSVVNSVAPLLRGLLAEAEDLPTVTFDDSEVILGLVGSVSGKEIALRGPWSPDQIVYCSSFPLWFEAAPGEDAESLHPHLADAAQNHLESTGFLPQVVLVKQLGMFAAGRDRAAAEAVRLCYVDAIKVAAGAERLGGARALGKRDREFIEHWEVEAYRREKSAGKRAAGCVAGKVALVTGAARGFGSEIAGALAAEGAHVALADTEEEGVVRLARLLESHHGPGRAMCLYMDVTDESAVAVALHEIVRSFGGLDLLVSVAGALRAGSVKTQPIRDLDLVTGADYKGHIVWVQKASPIMSLQHRAKPDYWSDIIHINSKSGLAGSDRNGAYSGSKFGGIGLTQSFALEHLEDGIKVNALCPGNYFESPLRTDPDNGLFAQHLRNEKAPDAKKIEDVRTAYEAKAPVARGCTTTDVMKAIYYLVEHNHTGQALSVTSGQVMLH